MANLLYAENNIGCYVGWNDGDYEVGVYCYGYETLLASYYADLEPNTTYTIQRIDTSTRFRIALTSTDVKYYTASSGTTAEVFSWGYKADSSNPVTFTTGDTNTHLVVYYTNNSEYNTKVMLNEGSSIEPYEAPTRYFKDHWHLINDELVYDGMPEPLDYLTPPYPASMWRLDSDNDLVNSLLPEPSSNFAPPYPASMWYLDDRNKLQNALLPDELKIGAFSNNMNLKSVYIPPSVKRIGPYSFMNTALTKVKIATECTYSEETFPPGCVINHY